MGFYSGKPGKSFQISKIFTSKEDMDKEAEDSLRPNDSLENYWTAIEVPVNGFVIISNPNDNEYEYNGKIFIKNFDGTNYSYSQVGSIGGVIPHIDANGLWSVDPNNASSAVGTRAVAKEIELEIETDREIAPLALLYREQSILDKENNIIEPGSTEKPIYGLANLSEKYSYTEEAGW
jgi:hypothetical protein